MISSQDARSERVYPPLRSMYQAWRWLTRPATSVTAPASQRQVRLLASMMLILTLLTASGILSVILSNSEGSNLSIQIALDIVFLISYVISRTHRYMWAAVLSGLSIALLPFISYLARGDYSYAASFDALIWTLIALVFASLFFSAKVMGIFTLGLLGSLAFLPSLFPEIEFANVFVVLTLNLIVGTISLVNKRHRDLQERDRQSELQAANLELQAMHSTLESRVAERTRDLALAAEIGNTISQVRQLDHLLAEAVELIRARFSIYYVQVYLADESGKNLVLQAGTGGIGRALVSQDHRLVFGPGSINGLAATNKKAVLVADTASSPIFFANRLLPETRSELAIPLLIADRVVGVLDLQSDQTNALTPDSLAAFGALAGQLAIAIENARLFTEVNQARAELEARAASQSRVNWSNFMDAIHRRERIESDFESPDMRSASALGEVTADEIPGEQIAIPISVAGADVGAIRLVRDPGQSWTDADRELAITISGQVAQKIENLRLLAEAEQYQQEAEEAARRLVRQGWQTYLESSKNENTGFLYDHEQVTPLSQQLSYSGAATIQRPLVIGGETIGYIDVADVADNEQITGLTEAIAKQLSAHIESLRLSQQTEEALATTEQQARRLAMLNEMSEALNRAATISDIYDIAASRTCQILAVENTVMAILDPATDIVEVIAVAGQDSAAAVGDRHLVVDGSPLKAVIYEKRLVTSLDDSDELSGIAATMMAPLIGETSVIGMISVGSESLNGFNLSDEILLLQIAAVLGATIERKHLADQMQARADHERTLRQITARVHAAADAQSILRTAAQEINRALGLETLVFLEASDHDSETGMLKKNGNYR